MLAGIMVTLGTLDALGAAIPGQGSRWGKTRGSSGARISGRYDGVRLIAGVTRGGSTVSGMLRGE